MMGLGQKKKKTPPAKYSPMLLYVFSSTYTALLSPNDLERNKLHNKIIMLLNLGKLKPLRKAKLLLLTPNSKD